MSETQHDHGHSDHDHGPPPDQDGPLTYYPKGIPSSMRLWIRA